jgi:hypothetical protein
MRPLSSTGGFKVGGKLKKRQNGSKPGLDRWGNGSKPLKKMVGTTDPNQRPLPCQISNLPEIK